MDARRVIGGRSLGGSFEFALTPEELFKDPPRAQGFAQYLAAVCALDLTRSLAEELGLVIETPAGRPQMRRNQARVIVDLASGIVRCSAPEALRALKDTLRKELAAPRAPVEAPLTVQDLETLGAAGQTADASDFRPLDDHVAREVEAFTGKQAQVLLAHWSSDQWTPPFAERRLKVFRNWQAALDVHAVAQYGAAAGVTIRRTLLDSGAPAGKAGGLLRGLRVEPTLVVFAHRGSALARDAGLGAREGEVEIQPAELAHLVASYCGEEALAGDFAWRSIAWWLPELDPILPKIEVILPEADVAQVRLAD
jgi:hypothetical protein